MAEPATHYDVLGVGRGATAAELRAAYVELARIHHPDRAGGDAARMRAVNAAWTTLRNPARRAAYDASIAGWPAGAPQAPAAAGGAFAEEPPEDDMELDGRFDGELDDLLHDLADDTPIGAVVVLPQWLSLLPVGLFFTSLGAFILGALLGQAALVGFGAVCFLLSCLLFVAAPFMALLSSRRRGHHPR